MKKVVIGLNLDFHLRAFIGILASVACMFVTFINSGNGKLTMIETSLRVLGATENSMAYFILVFAAALTILSAVLGLISLVKTTVTETLLLGGGG